jgi:peptidyl-prolyl cis-trans isomerase C
MSIRSKFSTFVAPRLARSPGLAATPLFLTAVLLALTGALVLTSPGHASDESKAAGVRGPAPSTPDQQTPSPRGGGVDPAFARNPAASLSAIADHLDTGGDAVAAEVEGRPITQGDVADVIRGMPPNAAALGLDALHRRALDQLIRQKLIAIAAEKSGLGTNPIVQRREKRAAEQVLVEAWLSRWVDGEVPEADVRARYDRDVAGKPGPEEVRAQVISVLTEADARKLIGQIQAGADFVELARKANRTAAGVDLGYLPIEAFDPGLGSVIFSLAPGQITAYPVRVPHGYFIVRVQGRRQRETPSFEAVRADLRRELRREALVGELRAQSTAARVNEMPPADHDAATSPVKP